MEQPISSSKTDAFRKIGFADKVRKCVDRGAKSGLRFQTASLEELSDLVAAARTEITLAPNEAIARLLAVNPDILRAVYRDQPEQKLLGMFAYLPLNAAGISALIGGNFSGLAPDPKWICQPDETPDAIYLWLVYLPNSLARSMAVIARAFDELVPESCPVFSKAVNDHAERLNRSMGFIEASTIYPDADPSLLVIFPERELPKTPKKSQYRIDIARTFEDMFKAMAIRSATYLAEQYCYFAEEYDGNDFCATHFIGYIGDDPAGCVRVRFFADFAKIERLAVRSEYRNSKLAFALARRAVDHCFAKGYRTIYGHSREDLVRFWRVFGFREMEGRASFSFASIRYSELILERDANARAVSLDSGPMVIIRPEGAWDRPGPLDISASENDPARRHLIGNRLRTVNGADSRA